MKRLVYKTFWFYNAPGPIILFVKYIIIIVFKINFCQLIKQYLYLTKL